MQKYLQQRSVCQIITTVIFTTSSVLKTKHLRFSRSMIKKLVLKHHIFQKNKAMAAIIITITVQWTTYNTRLYKLQTTQRCKFSPKWMNLRTVKYCQHL